MNINYTYGYNLTGKLGRAVAAFTPKWRFRRVARLECGGVYVEGPGDCATVFYPPALTDETPSAERVRILRIVDRIHRLHAATARYRGYVHFMSDVPGCDFVAFQAWREAAREGGPAWD